MDTPKHKCCYCQAEITNPLWQRLSEMRRDEHGEVYAHFWWCCSAECARSLYKLVSKASPFPTKLRIGGGPPHAEINIHRITTTS